MVQAAVLDGFPATEVDICWGLVPALDLCLRLGMQGRAADMFHALAFEVFRQIPREIGQAIITQTLEFVQNSGIAAA